MLISTEGFVDEHAPKVGACGEVMDSVPFANEIPVDNEVVHFPRNISKSSSGCWSIPHNYLIPLNDPNYTEDVDKIDTDELVYDTIS